MRRTEGSRQKAEGSQSESSSSWLPPAPASCSCLFVPHSAFYNPQSGGSALSDKTVNREARPERPSGYLELLRGNRNFRQLWLGQVISQLGDWFDTIALYTLLINLTGSGRAIGLLLVARFVPCFVV